LGFIVKIFKLSTLVYEFMMSPHASLIHAE